MSNRPEASEYPAFYGKYIAGVGDANIIDVLRDTGRELDEAVARIAEEKGSYRYAEGKWTIRTLLGHVIDAERIFTYRALRLARGDSTPLPGFDENTFAANAESDTRSVAALRAELAAVRASTVELFASLPDSAWTRTGTVNNGQVSVRALGYITAGHARHHLAILQERYGV